MTDFNLTLAYLRESVIEELGDIGGLVEANQVDRWINEGQRRMEPDIYKAKTIAVSVAAGDTSLALPGDLIAIDSFDPDVESGTFPRYRQHGFSVYFSCPVYDAWAGTLYYRAHFPAITGTAPAEVPVGCAHALVSFALYRAFRRFAANRAEYRKFATIVGNGVTMGDIEATAEAHLQDYADAANAATPPPAPEFFYG